MTFIYFLRRYGGRGAIKIGCSKNVPLRRHTISKAIRSPLETIAIVRGGFAMERWLKAKFDHLRLAVPMPRAACGTEWFAPSDSLLATVAAINAGVAVFPEDLRADASDELNRDAWRMSCTGNNRGRSASHAAQRFGSRRALAAAAGVSADEIDRWCKADEIPNDFEIPVFVAAEGHGVCLLELSFVRRMAA